MFELCFKDLMSTSSWGYGIKRIKLDLTKNSIQTPYTFTAYGYKSFDNKLYICVKMNVDQYSPVKKRECIIGKDNDFTLKKKCGEMITELVNENQLSHMRCINSNY